MSGSDCSSTGKIRLQTATSLFRTLRSRCRMPSSAGSHHSGADWAPVGQPPQQSPQQSPDLIYHEALRGALMLLRANGGEIATLDSTREALVSRSRQIYP